MSIEKRMGEMNIELPEIPQPIASYVLCKKTGNLLFVSGQGPVINGKILLEGKIRKDLTKEEGYEAARLTALNILYIVKNEIGNA